MLRAARSYLTALRASRRFGRAARLRDRARNVEAMTAAREALGMLSQPHVIRTNPAEASVLACATVLLEEVAKELQLPGAEERDIADSLKCIRGLSGSELTAWIPYLEWRLEHGDKRAV
jgi:hypothetical protein